MKEKTKEPVPAAPEEPAAPAPEFSEKDAQKLISETLEKVKRLLNIKDKTDAYHLAFVSVLVLVFIRAALLAF